RVAAVTPDDADDRRAALARQLQRRDQVRADVLRDVPAPDREYEHTILRPQPTAAQPLDEHARPPVVVGAGGELGDVVGRGVGLEAGDLAEVVDRVAAVRRTAADAEEEQPAAALADAIQDVHDALDRVGVELVDHASGLVEVLAGVAHAGSSSSRRVSSSPAGEPLSKNRWCIS